MMGNNSKGQLGQQTQSLNVGSPSLVETLKHQRVTSVTCGVDSTTCIVAAAPGNELATVYAWGHNKHGQLGLPSTQRVIYTPTRVEVFDLLDVSITQVSAGAKHTLYLTAKGEAVASGQNKHGQCGFNPEECQKTDQPFKLLSIKDRVVQISAGQTHSLFVTDRQVCLRTSMQEPYPLELEDVEQAAAGSA